MFFFVPISELPSSSPQFSILFALPLHCRIALLEEHILVTLPGSSKSVDKRSTFENIALTTCSLVIGKKM